MFNKLKEIFSGKSEDTKISEWSYQRFCDFCGVRVFPDDEFQSKMESIVDSIENKKIEYINEIAKRANCSYQECVLKIKYLKNKRIIDNNYYINASNGLIKMCDDNDLELLEKYHDMVYLKNY